MQRQSASWERARDRVVYFTPAIQKVGHLRSQIRLDQYYVTCVPFQMSTREAVLVAALSPREVEFFQQFQKSFCSINLSLEGSRGDRPLSLLLRGTLERIGSMRDRQGLCLMFVSLSSVPSGLRQLLDEYHRASLEAMRAAAPSTGGPGSPS